MTDNLLHLHLALGDSAGGVLRAACDEHGLPGAVHVIRDDLSHGPLHDGKLRLKYMRGGFAGYGTWQMRVSDAFADWDDLDARLTAVAADSDGTADMELAVWAGDNASEAVLLAMACQWLEGLAQQMPAQDAPGSGIDAAIDPGADGERATPAPQVRHASGVLLSGVRLAHVRVPKRRNYCYVAQSEPALLAPLFARRRRLPSDERAAQAALFRGLREASRAETGQLRRWQRGELVPAPADRLDSLLLRACTGEWRLAAGVIGSAMASCDPHNLASDLFLSSRLQCLIDRGRIEALGPREVLRDYWVRIPG